jgi:hypothetical protein
MVLVGHLFITNGSLLKNYGCGFALSRPIINGKRVSPEDLVLYRASHNFMFPSCLCAANQTQIAYTEVKVQLEVHGQHSGEWVVRCATNGCGYLGELNISFVRLCKVSLT